MLCKFDFVVLFLSYQCSFDVDFNTCHTCLGVRKQRWGVRGHVYKIQTESIQACVPVFTPMLLFFQFLSLFSLAAIYWTTLEQKIKTDLVYLACIHICRDTCRWVRNRSERHRKEEKGSARMVGNADFFLCAAQ